MTGAVVLDWLALAGIAIFAVSGALMALRKDVDIVGVSFIAVLTGIGGGTLRDILLGATPPNWVRHPLEIGLCTGVAIFTVLINRFMTGRRMQFLLWADAAGLALFAVLGTARAEALGSHPAVAVLLGAMSASFGGVIRDVICHETPVLLRREIYITAALVSGAVFLICETMVGFLASVIIGTASGFALRGMALWHGWSLPPLGGSASQG